MIYEFHIDGKAFHMEFEEHEEAPKAVERDLYGYTYMLNDRTYQDISFFKKEKIRQMSMYTAIYEDDYGERVFYCHTSLPTFDFGDREWDSAFDEYIVYDGKDVNLVTSRQGYRIAELNIYKKLLSVERGFEKYIRELGYPVEQSVYREF